MAIAPEPVKFDIGGVVKKVDNRGKFLIAGLLGIVMGVVIYIGYLNKKAKESKDKIG